MKTRTPVISKNKGRTTVRIINTDEELMIARTVIQILNLNFETEHNYENKESV
jgi:acetate kinase